MFDRLKKWISIKKSQNARMILLLSIIGFNIMLWFVSSLVTYIIDPSLYGSIVGSLWNSGITWMLEPGFYDPTVGVPIRIISIIVIITSMITFSGGIIAYVANLFSSIIEHARQGRNELFIYDHILILNWNSKALELIADYRYDDLVTDIVVLSNLDKGLIETQIKGKLYDLNQRSTIKHMNIIVKEGDVYSKHDLDKVCLEQAKTIIILSSESQSKDDKLQNPDILSIKSLMLIANSKLKPHQTIIVEIRNEATVPLITDKIARDLGHVEQIIPILPDEMLGRLIAQTILYPALNNVFQELFSFQGMEFYSSQEKKFDDVYQSNPYAIPIFNRNGYLYLLAGSEKDTRMHRDTKLAMPRNISINKALKYPETTIVIFGNNNKLKFILDSLKWFEADANTKVNVTLVPGNDPLTIKEHLDGISKIDTILVLSDDFLEPKDYDSDVLITLLMIQEIAKAHNAKIVLELLNPRHYDIAKSYNIDNTIISNQYISRIITQLSKNRSLYPLYVELLTYDSDNTSYEIYTFPVKEFILDKFPISFSSQTELIHSIYDNSEHEFMPIGYIKDNKLRIFSGNMDKIEEIILDNLDMLVVVCK